MQFASTLSLSAHYKLKFCSRLEKEENERRKEALDNRNMFLAYRNAGQTIRTTFTSKRF